MRCTPRICTVKRNSVFQCTWQRCTLQSFLRFMSLRARMPALVSFTICEVSQRTLRLAQGHRAKGMRHSPAACPGRVTEIPLVRQTNVDSVATKNRKNKRLEHWCFIAVRDQWLEHLCFGLARHYTARSSSLRFIAKISRQPRGSAAARQLSSSAAVSSGRVEPRPGRRQGSRSGKNPAVASGRKFRQRQIPRSRIRDGGKC